MPITPFIPPAFLTGLPTAIWAGAGGLPVLPFLPGQEIAVSKAPQWSTGVIRAASGRERRTAYWTFPLWQFELSYGVIRHRPSQAELFAMWEFFNTMQGQYGPWLFVDPTDCQIPTTALLDSAGLPILDAGGALILDDSGGQLAYAFAVADGTTRTFQLTRPTLSFAEPVFATYAATVLDNGAPAASYAVSSGQVTFAVAPAAGHILSWFGFYYFGCRFLQDDLAFEQIVQQLWAGRSLKFTSLRV